LGQLFSESGYEVAFVDVDEPLISALNEGGRYRLRLVDNEHVEEVSISPVRALHSGQAVAVAEALANADIAATAVGARVLPHIAPLVAAGAVRRAEAAATTPLNIIVCENLHEAAAAFREMVALHVPPVHRPYFETHVGFVDTVIGRMVPPPTPEMRAEDPALIVVEPYKELPVDQHGFKGEIPSIVGMEPCDNFGAYGARKLYLHNCGHAMLAYLGYQRGHKFGYEALDDPAIRPVFEEALAESQAGIVAAYAAAATWLKAHADELVHRYANRALGDTIFRLGRDPTRKLAPNDRLVGAARLAENAGVRPKALSWGIAAAYRFDPPEDPLAAELQAYLGRDGLEAAMARVSGIGPSEPLGALVCERYRLLPRWPAGVGDF
jgi:mannitol-1-phosphate 5-dehydrogenase